MVVVVETNRCCQNTVTKLLCVIDMLTRPNKPNSDSLQSNSDGLLPRSDGLQPNSEAC